jgi:hypothetical protein
VTIHSDGTDLLIEIKRDVELEHYNNQPEYVDCGKVERQVVIRSGILPDHGTRQPGLLEAGEAPRDKHPAGDLVVVRREREADGGDGLPLPSEVVFQSCVNISVEIVDLRAAEVGRTDVLGAAKQHSAGELWHAATLAHLE